MTEIESITPTERTHADLDAVRLIDVRACAAIGSVSKSWWNQMVAEGRAPQPAFRAPRMTRWRAQDVAAFWASFGSSGASNS